MANSSLNAAKAAKRDEFYTQLCDIESELVHYREHFRGRTVLCNCDDPYESNFFKYFALNFNQLGLRKLICTCYDGSPSEGTELLLDFGEDANGPKKTAYKAVVTEEGNTITTLRGNGDFRSRECVELLKEADIVCTNPPFSLFREYVAQLIQYGKKFLIIGNKNAVTCKDIFPLIKENKLWTGYNGNKTLIYESPYTNDSENNRKMVRAKGYDPDKGFIAVSAIQWFTNLPHSKRNEEMILWKSYERNREDFPKYDNYDAINVDKTADIPYDYDGVMGVPITFLDKYNPKQFEIVGLDGYVPDNPRYGCRFTINGQKLYARLLIRRLQSWG